MAAPVWQSGSVLAGAASGTAAVPVPSGTAAGDVIVVQLYLEASNAVTPPAGFTEKSNATAGPNEIWQRVFWKRVTGADAGTYDFTFTSTFRAAGASRVSGCVAAGDPFDAVATGTTDSTTSVTPAVSVTTTVPDTLLIWAATDFVGIDGWTPPAGFTERADEVSWTHATLAQTAAGGSGSVTGSFTVSAADSSTAWLGALLPAAGGPGPLASPALLIQQGLWRPWTGDAATPDTPADVEVPYVITQYGGFF